MNNIPAQNFIVILSLKRKNPTKALFFNIILKKKVCIYYFKNNKFNKKLDSYTDNAI